MVAPATTAPEESVTVPRMSPVDVLCAAAIGPPQSTQQRVNTQPFRVLKTFDTLSGIDRIFRLSPVFAVIR